ncbi:MAG: DUF4349 domain-containing protein [Acetivibrionales bacterium]|jgi:hypothetical protein
MVKRYICILSIIILLFSTFAGCSSSSKSEMAASTASAPAAQTADMAVESGKAAYGSDNAYPGEAAYEEAGNARESSIRKVIKNGEIAVEVKDVDSAYHGIMEIVYDLGGEEFNKNYRISGEYKRMELVLKIPPEKLDEFQNRLTEFVGNGKIKRTSISSEDITAEYYDTQSRLESYTASRNQLRELLKKAQTVEDTLKIHNELTRLQAEIDVLQGRVKMWDKLVSQATITLYIDEESDPLKHTKTVGWRFNSLQEVWGTMRNGFVTVVNTLYSLIIWLLIAIVSLLPVLVPAAVILWLILRRNRKKKNKNNSSPPLA